MSKPPSRTDAIELSVPAGARAVLDLPTGTVIVQARHISVNGTAEDLEELAAVLIAACWEARQAEKRPPLRWKRRPNRDLWRP